MSKLFTFLFLCLMTMNVFGQRAVYEGIENLKKSGRQTISFAPFEFLSNKVENREFELKGLRKGTVLHFDKKAIQSLLQQASDFIEVKIPVTDRSDLVLTLERNIIFAPDFQLFASDDPLTPLQYTPGLHYKGVLNNDPASLVALSVFEDQVMAMIATDEGNFSIGKIIGNSQGNHIFYNDRDLEQSFPFECGSVDDGIGYTEEQLKPQLQNRDLNDCVRIHIEINDDIVTVKGGAIPATDYITGLFNQSFVLYANDQLSLVISEILAWTTTSPYIGSNSSGMLSSYKVNTEYFNGDLSHLVSFDSIYGGVAYINGLCNSNPDNSKCFSGIRHNYQAVPLFSRPVNLITHEMGHLLGSRHTHACVWNGNNTAIDGCYETEGSCPLPALPLNGGTIMSYCGNYNNDSYINFNHGFGPQPGNVMRNNVNASFNCLSPCGQPTSYCESYGASGTAEYINKIVVANINNLSGNNNGYGNYTSLAANLNAGNTYTIALTPKFTGGNNTKYWRVYIDYNQDFDWYDAGECVGQGTGNNTINVTFIVPPGTPTLSTRMRVSMKLSGYPAFCGLLPFGEVEDYTISVTGITPTCTDGIQNQGETGVDCGGPCPACPPAPTCSDGIQNQGETGIDCGGPCGACPAGDSTILLGAFFETGMDTWIDGGSDVARTQTANSWEGQYSIKLADNDGTQSAMTSPAFNLSDAVGLHVSFHFYASSMEAGEDFWVLYNNGSGNWVNIGTYTSGTTFNNNQFYFSTITVPNFVPTANGSIRIQCDASDNNDQVFIDAVLITKMNGTELLETGMIVTPAEKTIIDTESQVEKEILVYPNPAKDILHISWIGEIQSIRLMSLNGQVLKVDDGSVEDKQINIESLSPGVYFLRIESGGRWYPARFIKL